jgi:hypothetical protein
MSVGDSCRLPENLDGLCERARVREVEEAAAGQETREKLRYPWIIGSLVVGGVIVAIAVVGSLMWNWRDIWSSLLLEIGSTVMLISAVFVVERQFVGQVRRVEARVEETERTVREALGECRAEDPPASISPVLTETGGLQWVCAHNPPHVFDSR